MNSSPTSSLRRSFSNMITKIGSKSPPDANSDEIKQIKASNLPCYVCGIKAKKNFQCKACSKIACLSDSGVTSLGNTARTCDSCIRLNIMNELSGSELAKEKLHEEIQEIASQRDANTKVLNKESARLRALEKELQESLDQNNIIKGKISKTINAIQKENENMEKDIKIKNSDNSKINAVNERDQNALNEIIKETEHLRIAVDEMIKERTILLSNLNELRDFIRHQVPVRIIKKVVCFNCYIAVQNAFANMFKHVAPIKTESNSKVPQKKHGACASCEVF